MGMSASQARLLTITARINDVEFQAQSIQNAKIQLANQSDRVYEDYIAALDATTLTLTSIDTTSGATSIITANFNNLCSRRRVAAANGEEYALRDRYGRLIVEDDIVDAYEDFKEFGATSYDRSAHSFAMFMLGIEDGENPDIDDIIDAEEASYNSRKDSDPDLKALHGAVEEIVNSIDDYSASSIYDTNHVEDYGTAEQKQAYKDAMNAYREKLYSKGNSGVIYGLATGKLSNPNITKTDNYNATEDFNTGLYNYFVSIYKQIEACGRCVSIEDYNGPDGDAASNSDWLQSMIKSGQITLYTTEYDKNTASYKMNAASPNSESVVAFTETSAIDKTAVAKAEAKYEHEMKQIDKKDKEFDLDLAKLDTERQALAKQYDSLKTVIDENIEKSFGIFS